MKHDEGGRGRGRFCVKEESSARFTFYLLVENDAGQKWRKGVEGKGKGPLTVSI